MKKSNKLKIKNGFIKFAILSVIIGFISCEKENDKDDDNTENPEIELNDTIFMEELIVDNSYFNQDSIDNLNLINEIYNNLGIGRNMSTGSDEISIFNVTSSFKPIVKHHYNELFTKKIIVSTDYQLNRKVIDSLRREFLEIDSNYLIGNYSGLIDEITEDTTYIYISIVLIKRIGIAELDINNPDINDYLRYKSSIVDGVDTDSINLTPDLFQSIYGDRFCSAFVLGVSMFFDIKVDIDFVEEDMRAATLEAFDMITKAAKGLGTWEDMKTNSKFFKESDLCEYDGEEIPRSESYPWSIDDIISELNYVENLYQKADFGILVKKYEHFSTLYPTYTFAPVAK
ncbi:MAG: hypothetical protein JXB49_37775 [Bacteroidales bacterium]|nr:hypothetical protein [Bacteroidales bacterium]